MSDVFITTFVDDDNNPYPRFSVDDDSGGWRLRRLHFAYGFMCAKLRLSEAEAICALHDHKGGLEVWTTLRLGDPSTVYVDQAAEEAWAAANEGLVEMHHQGPLRRSAA